MGRKYFGTDGVRGRVGEAPITPEFVMRLGYAAGRVLAQRTGPRPAVLIGKDTRISGYLLEAALEAGFSAAGVDVLLSGPLPTPAVAYLTRALRLSAGVVISASHNPYEDNGIKFFDAEGGKLSDELEERIEAELANGVLTQHSRALGRASRVDKSRSHYQEFCASTLPAGVDLAGMKVVVDCANGAGYKVAPRILADLGAEIVPIGCSPNGRNINDGCGSTHPEVLQAAVLEAGAHLGLAFDGDADRLLAVDEQGRLVDGDQIMALCATDLRDRGRLTDDTVVVTVMSNLGFRQAMGREGITVIETAVGDRHVLAAMAEGDLSLGGEQSGHLVFGDLGTTGDGLLSAVVLADLVVREGVLGGEVTVGALVDAAMTKLPQVLRNVAVDAPMPDVADRLADEIDRVGADLGDQGRVLLRPSGTEPVVRVMAEAATEEAAAAAVDRLVAAVEALRTPA